MCIAFVPFPTNLIAEHFHDDGLRAAALIYGVTMTVTAICFGGFWFYAAAAPPGRAEDADPQRDHGHLALVPARAPIYGAATLVAVWSPRSPSLSVRGDRALLRARELRSSARAAAAESTRRGRMRVVPAPGRAREQRRAGASARS